MPNNTDPLSPELWAHRTWHKLYDLKSHYGKHTGTITKRVEPGVNYIGKTKAGKDAGRLFTLSQRAVDPPDMRVDHCKQALRQVAQQFKRTQTLDEALCDQIIAEFQAIEGIVP